MTTILCPSILVPLKKLLDKLIFIIGWFTSTISLLIVFYLIFTPIAVLLKIFGKDLLNEKIDKKAFSYWIERKKRGELSLKDYYERMGYGVQFDTGVSNQGFKSQVLKANAGVFMGISISFLNGNNFLYDFRSCFKS